MQGFYNLKIKDADFNPIPCGGGGADCDIPHEKSVMVQNFIKEKYSEIS